MYEKFKKILVEELNIDPEIINMDADLAKDLGINSLEMADLSLLCEDEMGITIDDDQLSKFITVGDVVNYLQTLE